ncbi:MAG: competence/damage-inducible protein A, partial [Clostridia bacterium]|nr:competence/damage-inducible protein A [Clostridia bacterium]
MTCELVFVGTELLLGDILNTNAQYLSRQLAALGISVLHQSVVGDNPERLRQVLETALSRADLVMTTGGLGPTKDDLTKEV